MPVFGACFFARSFCRYAKVQRLCERAKGNASFYSLSCEYIYNVRAYIYNKLFIIPSSPSFPCSSLFPSFPTLLIFCEFAPNRPAARKFANYEAFKIPLSVLMQAFVLIFGFVFFCSLLFRLPLSVARTDLGVFPSLVSLFSVEHIS